MHEPGPVLQEESPFRPRQNEFCLAFGRHFHEHCLPTHCSKATCVKFHAFVKKARDVIRCGHMTLRPYMLFSELQGACAVTVLGKHLPLASGCRGPYRLVCPGSQHEHGLFGKGRSKRQVFFFLGDLVAHLEVGFASRRQTFHVLKEQLPPFVPVHETSS